MKTSDWMNREVHFDDEYEGDSGTLWVKATRYRTTGENCGISVSWGDVENAERKALGSLRIDTGNAGSHYEFVTKMIYEDLDAACMEPCTLPAVEKPGNG